MEENKDDNEHKTEEKKEPIDRFGLRKRRFIVTVGGSGLLMLSYILWVLLKP